MNEICEEGNYVEAFETLMQAIDKNDIAFGNGQYWALGKIEEACHMADARSYIMYGEWISVNDRLPRVGEYVIAYGDNGPKGCCMAFVNDDDEWLYEIDNHYENGYGITHWMPLPEAPKE